MKAEINVKIVLNSEDFTNPNYSLDDLIREVNEDPKQIFDILKDIEIEGSEITEVLVAILESI